MAFTVLSVVRILTGAHDTIVLCGIFCPSASKYIHRLMEGVTVEEELVFTCAGSGTSIQWAVPSLFANEYFDPINRRRY